MARTLFSSREGPGRGLRRFIHKEMTMTTQSITSGQQKQLMRFVEDAPDNAFAEIGFEKGALQRLIARGGEFPQRIVAAIRDLTVSQLDGWQTSYEREFGITLDLSTLAIPAQRGGFTRLVVVAEGMTPNKVFEACRDHFPCARYTDDLDSITSDSAPSRTYAVWFRDRVEADEEMRDKSANNLYVKNVACVTLFERLLMELKYFQETGRHLDVVNRTLCAGSRGLYNVPCVNWYMYGEGIGMYVGWYHLHSHNKRLRARVAVR